MKIAEQTIQLKNGETCILRSPIAGDAGAVLKYMHTVFSQTDNLSCYPDEFTLTPEQEAVHLTAVAQSETAAMVGAFVNGVLVGDASVQQVSGRERLAHRAELGIAVQKECWGLGIATALMDACMDAAWDMGFELVQLDVVSTNEAAIGLYKKFEFEQFGLQPKAFKYRDGHYADLVHMQRQL